MIDVPAQPAPGINLIGFLRAESGLGEVARRLGRAIERSGVPFAALDYGHTPSRREHPVPFATAAAAPYDTTILCLNANELPAFVETAGVELLARTHTIGVWFWETDVFREDDRRAFVYVDEIWVSSAYVRDAVAGGGADVPVLVMPVPVEAAETQVTPQDVSPEAPPGYVFLSLFDLVSSERKNPLDVVEAFRRAFEPGEGPTLVLKTINGRDRKPQLLAELTAAAAERSDIVVRDGYVSVPERDALIAGCDCFVSLHRSEGYGLTMAEAMALGKPVIATGYSGNLEFMDEGSAFLVPYELVPVPRGWWAHAPGAMWAQPDVDAAADAMSRVFADPDAARALGARAAASILGRNSLDRTATFVEGRFSVARSAVPSPQWAEQRRHVISAALQASRGPSLGAADHLGDGIVGALRRALLRALWPQLEDQHAFDVEVVDALARMKRSAGPDR